MKKFSFMCFIIFLVTLTFSITNFNLHAMRSSRTGRSSRTTVSTKPKKDTPSKKKILDIKQKIFGISSEKKKKDLSREKKVEESSFKKWIISKIKKQDEKEVAVSADTAKEDAEKIMKVLASDLPKEDQKEAARIQKVLSEQIEDEKKDAGKKLIAAKTDEEREEIIEEKKTFFSNIKEMVKNLKNLVGLKKEVVESEEEKIFDYKPMGKRLQKIRKGDELIRKIATGEEVFAKKASTKEEYRKAIEAVCESLLHSAKAKDQKFSSGAIVIEDENEGLYKFLRGYVVMMQKDINVDKEKVLAGRNEGGYARHSSHLQSYHKFGPKKFRRSTQYGIDLKTPIVTSTEEKPNPDQIRPHLLFGQFDPEQKLLFVKFEQFGLNGPKAAADHLVDLFRKKKQRKKGEKKKTGELFKKRDSRERVPKEILREYEKLLRDNNLPRKKIEIWVSQAKARGISGILKTIEGQQFNKRISDFAAFENKLRKSYEDDNLDIRIGNEVIIRKKELRKREMEELSPFEDLSARDSFAQMEKDFKKTEEKIDNWRKNVISAASKELQEKSKELEEAQKNIEEFDTYLSKDPENERLKEMKKDLETQLNEKEKSVEDATKKLVDANKKLVDLRDDLKKMRLNRVEEKWSSSGALKNIVLDNYKKAEQNLRDSKASLNTAQSEVNRLFKETNTLQQSVKMDIEILEFAKKILEPEEAGSPTTYPEAVEKIRVRLEKNEQALKKTEKKLKAAKVYKTKKEEELESARQSYEETKEIVLKTIEDTERERSLTEGLL